MNITITILSNTLTKQQFSRLMPQTAAHPAFSGFPNDWLSPTDAGLGTHGIWSMRGFYPILLCSFAPDPGGRYGRIASARVCWGYYNAVFGKMQEVIFAQVLLGCGKEKVKKKLPTLLTKPSWQTIIVYKERM